MGARVAVEICDSEPEIGPSMTKTEQLDALFARWQAQCPGREFTKDGIIDESAWDAAPRRVLFLLKEDNKNRPVHEDDLRTIWRAKPWPILDTMAFGLHRLVPGQPLPSWIDAYAIRATGSGLRSAAVMNLKKEPGGGEADRKQVQTWVGANLDMLREQIKIISPDIVVCGGTLGEYVLPTGLVQLGKPVDPGGACYLAQGALWVEYHHPSLRLVREVVSYYGLLAIVEQALRNVIAQRAYELFLARGGAHGNDVEDWMTAERSLHFSKDNPTPR